MLCKMFRKKWIKKSSANLLYQSVLVYAGPKKCLLYGVRTFERLRWEVVEKFCWRINQTDRPTEVSAFDDIPFREIPLYFLAVCPSLIISHRKTMQSWKFQARNLFPSRLFLFLKYTVCTLTMNTRGIFARL